MIAFIAGAFIASLTVTDKTGLAGGATVFFGGVIGALIGLIIGVLVSKHIRNPIIRNLISVIGFLLLLGFVLLLYRQ